MSKSVPGPPTAANALARPASVVMSAATGITLPGAVARKLSAAWVSTSAPRATITRFTPSSAKARAHSKPRPLLAPHTRAHFPAIPYFMSALLPALSARTP